MKKILVTILSLLPLVAFADTWTISTTNGYKGVIHVNAGSGLITSGWFINAAGTHCPILPNQYIAGLRYQNLSGNIGTTCGTWHLWKGRYAVPTVNGVTSNGYPFGWSFNGKVELN